MILPGFLAVFFAPPLEYLYLSETLPRGLTIQLIGLFIIVIAVFLHLWTRVTLKRMYSGSVQVQPGHTLVREGPYRFVRHPGYAGFILMALGLCIGYSSLIGLIAILILMLPGLAYRMQVEEKYLIEAFGDAYRDYTLTTKRILPGIR